MNTKLKLWFKNALKDNYKFIKILSKSELSECKLMRHKTLNKNIVVHTYRNRVDIEVYKRLINIKDEHIVQIYDVFDFDDEVVVLEEYVGGVTLDSVGIMNPLGVKRLLIQLCDGLNTLHSIGIIHKDIKTSNLILNKDGTLKIIDFDISKIYRSSIDDTTRVGTIIFASPEQCDRYAIKDERSDIFAIGIVANYLLTGKSVGNELYDKGILKMIIQKCTMQSPNSRFHSVLEIKAILDVKSVEYF